MTDFTYGWSMSLGGYTWYCQLPGVCWRTDPVVGWELYYTDGPSWHLIGHGDNLGWEVSLDTERFKVAMDRAADTIEKIKNGEPV